MKAACTIFESKKVLRLSLEVCISSNHDLGFGMTAVFLIIGSSVYKIRSLGLFYKLVFTP